MTSRSAHPHPAEDDAGRGAESLHAGHNMVRERIALGDYTASDASAHQGAQDLTQQWLQIRRCLREELGAATFNSWLRPLEVISLGDGCVTMSVPTKFMRDWVEKNYADKLRAHWAGIDPSVGKVDILLNGKAMPPAGAARPDVAQRPCWNQADRAVPLPSASQREAVQARPVASTQAAEARTGLEPKIAAPGVVRSPAHEDEPGGPLEEKNTFDNFVVGKSNELAHAAARRVAESDAVPFNPLFLHGVTGLGKTHLMHAIAWEVRRRYPERKVIYLSAEKFMYQFVAAIRHQNQLAFKKQFRNVDLLMIDDFQYISGKATTQEEFFHTFNALVDHNRQVVISADRSPSDLENVEERIRSRLSWGLVADIHPTDFELRLGILHAKARNAAEIYGHIDIPEAVLEFLAHKITSNVRELEGALHRLLAHAALVGRPINVDTAQEVLRPLIRANARKVTVEEIQRRVADYYDIKHQDMLSPRRARMVARPRQVAMYLAKQLTTRSLPDIGRRFGGRDHTTVMHAVRKIEELRRSDPMIDEAVENLRRLLET